ncbi:MAG: hypothetical protein Q8Q02_10030 [Nocardioides sp.]|nr:hypothetical protein [Nocardioides sp.]
MLCATAVHRTWYGLPLGVATSVVVLLALRPGWTRTLYAAGWLGAGLVLVGDRPGGDAWFLADLPAYTVMGVAFVMVAVALATLPVRPHLSSGE